MKAATFTLLFLLGLSSCPSSDDDEDGAPTELPTLECAESEQPLYPGCEDANDPPSVYGCYVRCEESECPSGLSCIEVLHNPCFDGKCLNCAEIVQVCD